MTFKPPFGVNLGLHHSLTPTLQFFFEGGSFFLSFFYLTYTQLYKDSTATPGCVQVKVAMVTWASCGQTNICLVLQGLVLRKPCWFKYICCLSVQQTIKMQISLCWLYIIRCVLCVLIRSAGEMCKADSAVFITEKHFCKKTIRNDSFFVKRNLEKSWRSLSSDGSQNQNRSLLTWEQELNTFACNHKETFKETGWSGTHKQWHHQHIQMFLWDFLPIHWLGTSPQSNFLFCCLWLYPCVSIAAPSKQKYT